MFNYQHTNTHTFVRSSSPRHLKRSLHLFLCYFTLVVSLNELANNTHGQPAALTEMSECDIFCFIFRGLHLLLLFFSKSAIQYFCDFTLWERCFHFSVWMVLPFPGINLPQIHSDADNCLDFFSKRFCWFYYWFTSCQIFKEQTTLCQVESPIW